MKTLTLLYNLVVKLTTTGGIVPPLFLVLVSMLAVFNWVKDMWTMLIAKLALMTTFSSAGLNFSGIGLINTFFPLTETLSLLTAYLGVLLIAAAIRIVKSFVPSIAS